MKATRLVALGVGLAYASHVGAMVGMAWSLRRKYRGTGHAGKLSDHLPAYAYPRRRIGPALVPGDRVVPPGKLVFD